MRQSTTPRGNGKIINVDSKTKKGCKNLQALSKSNAFGFFLLSLPSYFQHCPGLSTAAAQGQVLHARLMVKPALCPHQEDNAPHKERHRLSTCKLSSRRHVPARGNPSAVGHVLPRTMQSDDFLSLNKQETLFEEAVQES